MIENFTPKFSKKPIKVIGCGLAGAEVAFILANNGFDVHIFDNNAVVKRDKFSYYDKYENYMTENMKYELECLNSPLFSIAKKNGFKNFGFEYDDAFMEKVKEELLKNPKIKFFDVGIKELCDNETTVITTGHTTEKEFLDDLENYIGKYHICYFQPEKMVIDAESVDKRKIAFSNKTDCYVSLTEDEYKDLYQKIIEIDKKYRTPDELMDEKQITVESIAKRGISGLRNSMFRPHFLSDRRYDEKPYANLKMTYKPANNVYILDDFISAFDNEEQKEIIDTMGAIRNCNIIRYSSVKRKTYLLTPACLNDNLQLLGCDNFYACGGFSGTAGGFESLLIADYCAYSIIARKEQKKGFDLLKQKTCISLILNSLLKNSVVNFRLFNLKYDIIDDDDVEHEFHKRHIEVQKLLSKSQIEKFKEIFYGKYF